MSFRFHTLNDQWIYMAFAVFTDNKVLLANSNFIPDTIFVITTCRHNFTFMPINSLTKTTSLNDKV